MTKIKLNMLCCCASRDIFGMNDEDKNDVSSPDNYEILQYSNGFSYLYSSYPGLNILDEDFNKLAEQYKKEKNYSNFWMRCTLLSITKKYLDFLSKRSSDYLIIDNAFIRLNLLELENGIIISDTRRDFINYLSKYNLIPKIKKSILSSDVDYYQAEIMLDKFCKSIREIYPEEKIIIIQVKPANLIYDYKTNEFSTLTSSDQYKKMENLFETYYKMLVKLLPNAITIPAPDVLISDTYHKWGKHYLHYLKEYYIHYYLPVINKVIYEKGSIDTIKSKFEGMIYNKYLKLYINNVENSYREINKYINAFKYYNLISFHKNVLILDISDMKLKHSNINNICYYKINAYKIKDKLALYVIINYKIYYITNINSEGQVILDLSPILINYIQNPNGSISLIYNNKYLSARKQGHISFMEWNREWENFILKEF